MLDFKTDELINHLEVRQIHFREDYNNPNNVVFIHCDKLGNEYRTEHVITKQQAIRLAKAILERYSEGEVNED